MKTGEAVAHFDSQIFVMGPLEPYRPDLSLGAASFACAQSQLVKVRTDKCPNVDREDKPPTTRNSEVAFNSQCPCLLAAAGCPRLNLDLFPIFAAQDERRVSSRKAEHLMGG